MEILGATIGLSYSTQALRDQIAATGWDVTKVKFDKKADRYVATAKNSRGQIQERAGRTERLALSNLLIAVTRRQASSTIRLARWQTVFTNQLADIAEAYSKAPLYEPKASASFMELARDCTRRAKALSEHLQIQVVNDPEPYTSAEKLVDDIKKRRRLIVSRSGADHPLWSEKQVVDYRICHDVLGYAAADAGWDWHGENMAFAAHVALLGIEAQKALFSESIAQTAYATHYRAYGPQKVALFPQFMNDAQEHENPHKGYPGVHPSQSFPAVPQPSVKPTVASSFPPDLPEPENGLESLLGDLDHLHFAAIDPSRTADPNLGYQTGVDPIQMPNGLTIQQAYGDPLEAGDPETNNVVENAAKIIPKYNDTEWAYLNQNDPAELEVMKRAIVNAFRVVLLSPRKDLRWNAVHYQDIADVPGSEDNPNVYWDRLEQRRQEWNVARGYDRYGHIPYMKQVPALVNLMYQRDPQSGFQAAQQRAKQLLFDWRTEEQEAVEAEDANKPEAKRRQAFQVETKANYRLQARLKSYLAEHKPELDHAVTRRVRQWVKGQPPTETQLQLGEESSPTEPMDLDQFARAATTLDENAPGVPDRSKYGAFMGNHLKAVAAVSHYVDDILKAALEDVHDHDGTGHHFRATVLRLSIPGVGPKVCSFAWLLLQPMTSQLATIDTHIMDVLGKQEKEMSNRDYFGMERMLQAGRDAAGYGHVPMGAFQWGMWDYKRTGPGSHQDHSAMRVLDPVGHETVDWANKEQPINAQEALEHKANWRTNPPEWWGLTKDAQQQAWDDYQTNIASGVGKNQIPYQGLPEGYDLGPEQSVYTARLAASLRTPWFVHPESGERLVGLPGETLMAHATRAFPGLSVPEIWARLAEADAGKDPQQLYPLGEGDGVGAWPGMLPGRDGEPVLSQEQRWYAMGHPVPALDPGGRA